MKTNMLLLLAAGLLTMVLFPSSDSEVKAAGISAGGYTPATVVLQGESSLMGPVTFDHAMHTAISSDCNGCHHQHQGVDVAQCVGCHDLETLATRKVAAGGIVACRHCHGEITPDAPGMPGLKVAYHRKCFTCHLGMKGLGEGPQGCTSQCHTIAQP